jgi:hypothetical protein
MTSQRRSSCVRGALVARLVSVLLPASLSILAPVAIRAQGDSEKIDPAHFLARYRKAVHELRATYSNVRIDGSIRTVFPIPASAKERAGAREGRDTAGGPQRVRENMGFSYTYCDGKERVSRFLQPGPKESVFVSAGDTQFGLAHANPQGPYVLRNLSKGGQEIRVVDVLRRRVRDAPYRPAGVYRFDEYVDSPQFKIEKVSRVKEAGQELTRVVLHYLPPGEREQRIDGHIDLDESMGLVIRSCELELRWSTPQGPAHVVVGGSVNYKEQNGKAVPTEVNFSQHAVPSNANNVTYQWEYRITRYSLESTPPEQFTLAAFGLGDYQRTLSQVHARSAYRTSVIAVGALLAAFVLFRIGRSIQKGRKRAGATVSDQRGAGDSAGVE